MVAYPLFAVLTALPLAIAAPTASGCGCDTTDIPMDLPQSVRDGGIEFPDAAPAYILLGRGVQNYTCVNGAYDNNMALATLFDASCVLADGTEIAELPQKALSEPNPEVQTNSCQKLLESATPTFDLRSTGKGDYISVSKDSAVADASSGENVAWLQLSAIEGEGSLSKKVFRTYPAGGVPPETCSEDQEGVLVDIEYASFYVFFE